MNAKIVGCAIAAVFGFAAAAQATDLYSFSPAKTPFTGTGQGTLSGAAGNLTCTVSLTGKTDNTSGVITGVTFSGADGCEVVMAAGLPWKFRAVSFTAIQLTHATVAIPGLGQCGPNELKGTLSAGTLTLMDTLPSKKLGACAVNATITLSPAISINN